MRLTRDDPAAHGLPEKAYRVAMRQGARAMALRALLAVADRYGPADAVRRRIGALLGQLPAAPLWPDVADAMRLTEADTALRT